MMYVPTVVRFTFASASPDNIKQWKFPDGNFVQNLTGHSSIINCLAVNGDNVLVSGGTWFVCLFVFVYFIVLVEGLMNRFTHLLLCGSEGR